MNEATADSTEVQDDESPIKLFGDPRSAQVKRGPDRRSNPGEAGSPEHHETVRVEADRHPVILERTTGPGRALRLGRGDGFATLLNALGIFVFAVAVISGTLILNNAQDVGAFSDPWNSNRVAIGFAVLGLGIVHAAILVGVARALTYQLATLRLKMREADHAEAATASHG